MLNLHGLHLDDTQIEAVLEMMNQARKEKIYFHPWDDLEKDLKRKHLTVINLIGYGSLMNPELAARTLSPQSIETRHPVIAFGGRRLFDYEMPANMDWYLPPENPLARAALNVKYTGEISDLVNGIVLNLPEGEINPMRNREIGYNLIPVACLGWNKLDEPPYLAYILSRPGESNKGGRGKNEDLLPHHQYYRLCRKGASAFGEHFLELWLTTTYLADGITPVSKWEDTEFKNLD